MIQLNLKSIAESVRFNKLCKQYCLENKLQLGMPKDNPAVEQKIPIFKRSQGNVYFIAHSFVSGTNPPGLYVFEVSPKHGINVLTGVKAYAEEKGQYSIGKYQRDCISSLWKALDNTHVDLDQEVYLLTLLNQHLFIKYFYSVHEDIGSVEELVESLKNPKPPTDDDLVRLESNMISQGNDQLYALIDYLKQNHRREDLQRLASKVDDEEASDLYDAIHAAITAIMPAQELNNIELTKLMDSSSVEDFMDRFVELNLKNKIHGFRDYLLRTAPDQRPWILRNYRVDDDYIYSPNKKWPV